MIKKTGKENYFSYDAYQKGLAGTEKSPPKKPQNYQSVEALRRGCLSDQIPTICFNLIKFMSFLI